MLLSINIGQIKTFLPHVLLHCRVHCQLLADSMSRQRPSELVPPLDLVFETGCSLDVLRVRVDALVIATDGFGDGLRLHFL